MKYQIVYDKPAVKFLKRQTKEKQKWIIDAIRQLPHTGDIKTLAGHPGVFRLRVGGYRVIYSIENEILIIRILDIGNRGDVYKQWFLPVPVIKEPAFYNGKKSYPV